MDVRRHSSFSPETEFNRSIRIMRPGFFLDNYIGFVGSITVAVMARGLKKDSKLGVVVGLSLNIFIYCSKPRLRTQKTLAMSLPPCSRYAFPMGEVSSATNPSIEEP